MQSKILLIFYAVKIKLRRPKQQPYDLKVNISPGEGVTKIKLQNSQIDGWISFPYTVKQLSKITYNSANKTLTFKFSGHKIKICKFSVEKHSGISFVLKDHLKAGVNYYNKTYNTTQR